MWNKEFSVGDATIDEQHKRLLESLERLVLALEENDIESEIEKTIKFLEKYITEHLEYEEVYMKNHGFPDIEQHIGLHDGFRKKFQYFRNRIDNDGIYEGLGEDVREYMEEWWVLHILHDDKLYRKHIDRHPGCHPQGEPEDFHTTIQ